MKIALSLLVGSLSVWAAGCCGGPGVALVSSDPSSSAALVAGGARAGFRVVGAGGSLPTGMTLVSSDPTVAAVVVQPDAQGHAGVVTGTPGTATLTLSDANGVLDTLEISVRVPVKLVAVSGHAIAHEVVGLRIQIHDAEGAVLSGSGLVEASVAGTGTRAKGAAVEGVERIYLTGTPGQATVHATLGALALDATVGFSVPRVMATTARSNTVTNCRELTESCATQSTSEVAIDVRDAADVPLAGGKCAWTVTGGATLISDDSAIDVIEPRSGARVATFDVPRIDGPATATCVLGGQSSTVTLR